MIGFLPLARGRFLPLSRIKRICEEEKREGRVLPIRSIDLFDAASIEVEACEVDGLLKRPIQLMPAECGIQLLNFDFWVPDDLCVIRTPLIAWALCVDGDIRPVTPAGVDDGGDEPDYGWYVEMPDKRVFCTTTFAGPGFFTSADEALGYFSSQRQRAVQQQEGAQS